jgi:RHS repeat-associated protein
MLRYADLGWGPQLVSETDGYGSTDPQTTSYTYHADSSNQGNYGHIQTVTDPTGKWKAFYYYNDADLQRIGLLQYEVEPWLDAPAMVPASSAIVSGSAINSGHAFLYDYAMDWLGRRVVRSAATEYVNGQAVGKSTVSPTYPSNMNDAQPRAVMTQDAYSDATNYLRNTVTTARTGAGGDYVGRVRSIVRPDGTMSSCAYTHGTYNSSTKLFSSLASNQPVLSHWREITWNGLSAFSVGATVITQNEGLDIEPIYLVPNRSTKTMMVRDIGGDIVRSETYIYTGEGSFALTTTIDFAYDIAGRRIQTITNTGATSTSTFASGFLTTSSDQFGTETQNTNFDVLGRVVTQVKKGAPAAPAVLTPSLSYPAQGDIATTFTYDAMNRVTQQTMSGGALTQTTSWQFDLSGRNTQQTIPGGYVTGIGYSSAGKIVTTTMPGTETKVTENYLDGKLKQVSGAGVVGSVLTYSVDSAARILRQITSGGVSSAWTKVYSDWLGRPVEELVPGWNGTLTAKVYTYNSRGQLVKLSEPGTSDKIMVYDAFGKRFRAGLDANSNGALDLGGADPVSEIDYSTYIDGLGRATSEVISKEYATAGSSVPTIIGIHKTMLSGLGTGVLNSSLSTDIFGNVTSTTLTVDRANKKTLTTVNSPTSDVDQVQVSINGLRVESRDTAGVTTRTEYDTIGRAYKQINPRTGATTTVFIPGSSQVLSVKDPANITVATYTYDVTGRIATMTNGLSKVARYAYTNRGEVFREWGDIPNPVEYGYDTSGRRTSMKTYRGGTGWTGSTWPASPGTADTTSWTFDAPTGLLSSTTDGNAKVTAYTYTQARQLASRTWARNVATTYSYSDVFGSPTGAIYSDGTPSVSYTYDRLGRVTTVTDYAGTRMLDNCICGKIAVETLPASFYGGRVLTNKMDSSTVGAIGRDTGFSLGTAANPAMDQNVSYTYENTGRLAGLTSTLGGVSAGSFSYGYVPASNLMATVTESGSGMIQSKVYDPMRDIVSLVAVTLPSRNLATFVYTNDSIGRRTAKVETGELFSRYGTGITTVYGYNSRDELTSAQTFLGSNSTAGNALHGRNFNYAYDAIGNRINTTVNGQSSTYASGSANEILSHGNPGYADVSGFASANATVTVAGQSTLRQLDYFYRQHALSNASSGVATTLSINSAVGGGATTTENRFVYLAKASETITHDDDGNITSDGRWIYTWDAENRLSSMSTTSTAVSLGVPQMHLQFRYDFAHRRIEKKVFENGSAVPSVFSKFIYSSTGFNLLAEIDALAANSITQSYTWGLDLTGSKTAAGGVGALLAIRDTATSAVYHPIYDANGNVSGLINRGTGVLAAAYEYSPFGETLRSTGAFADKNRFRYSTKYTDVETQLVYYGYRYYNPAAGRFVSRDPIGLQGGNNLYRFLGNSAINAWDVLGLTEDDDIEEGGTLPWEDVNTTPCQTFKVPIDDCGGYAVYVLCPGGLLEVITQVPGHCDPGVPKDTAPIPQGNPGANPQPNPPARDPGPANPNPGHPKPTKKECDALLAVAESSFAESNAYQSLYDRQRRFVSAVQRNFVDDYSQEGWNLLYDGMQQGFQMGVVALSGPFNPFVSQVWDAVKNAGDGPGGAAAAAINVAEAGYFLKNIVQAAPYRSATFPTVLRVNGGGGMIAATIATTIFQHTGHIPINESRQSAILQAYSEDLAGLMTQSASSWVKGENAQKTWKARGCDKL